MLESGPVSTNEASPYFFPWQRFAKDPGDFLGQSILVNGVLRHYC